MGEEGKVIYLGLEMKQLLGDEKDGETSSALFDSWKSCFSSLYHHVLILTIVVQFQGHEFEFNQLSFFQSCISNYSNGSAATITILSKGYY